MRQSVAALAAVLAMTAPTALAHGAVQDIGSHPDAPEPGTLLDAGFVGIGGTGVEAMNRKLLKVAPKRIDFGTQPVGSESLDGVTVTNRSASDLRLLVSAALPDDFGFGLLPGSTCPALDPGAILAAETSCDAVVRFSPTEFFAGLEQTGTLTITASDPATGELLETIVVPVEGRGGPSARQWPT